MVAVPLLQIQHTVGNGLLSPLKNSLKLQGFGAFAGHTGARQRLSAVNRRFPKASPKSRRRDGTKMERGGRRWDNCQSDGPYSEHRTGRPETDVNV